ncbi:MAG: chromate transporter [Defluviitaleaceae bacterium]|nr:chromate transporter [Defluviitaleaceae bacterium]
MKQYKEITVAFLRAGALGFGGGAVCLPLIQREVVEKYAWMSHDEFGEIVAISNTLPGPINTKMAGYVGYRVAGIMGAIIAVCATILPSAIVLIMLLETLSTFREHPVVSGMLQAIVPVVGVMLALMGWQFLTSASKEMKKYLILIHVLVIALLVAFLNVHPALVVGGLIGLALFSPQQKSKIESEGGK